MQFPKNPWSKLKAFLTSKQIDMSIRPFLNLFILLKVTQNNDDSASNGVGVRLDGPVVWAMEMQAWTMWSEKPSEMVVYLSSLSTEMDFSIEDL